MLQGVYTATKKNGSKYYRSSLTYQNKHISLGSFADEFDAHSAYKEALTLIHTPDITIADFRSKKNILSFDKWVALINFRDHKIYFKNPIYLKKNYFLYYLSPKLELKFDIDDLFYYSSHKIMKRQGHLFVADYGMQINILSRYGIKNYALAGKDFLFLNGDDTDYRYANIKIINPYYGVQKIIKNEIECYKAKIHIIGDYTIGIYETETEAAIAYNKAIDILKKNGISKNYTPNYIENLLPSKYADIYAAVSISPKVKHYGLSKN